MIPTSCAPARTPFPDPVPVPPAAASSESSPAFAVCDDRRCSLPSQSTSASIHSDLAKQLAGPSLAERHQLLAHFDRQMLRCLYEAVPVDNEQLLLHMLRRHVDLRVDSDRLRLSDRLPVGTLAESWLRQGLVQPDAVPGGLLVPLMARPSLMEVILRSRPCLFEHSPPETRTLARLAALLPTMDAFTRQVLLREIEDEEPGLICQLESPEQRVQRNPRVIAEMDPALITPRLRQLAVAENCTLLQRFQLGVSAREYSQLCDSALEESGCALEWMHINWRTEARIERALNHRHPPHIGAIPEHQRTRERLRRALENSSELTYCAKKLPSLWLDEWRLWDVLKKKPYWLEYLPPAERTEALCAQYIAQYPTQVFATLPAAVRRQHPEWIPGLWNGAAWLRLDEHRCLFPQELDASAMTELVNQSAACMGQIPCVWRARMPPWVVVLSDMGDQIRYLPAMHRRLIRARGDTGGLAAAFRTPALSLDPDALLDPIQEEHCSRRAAWLPARVRRHLMFCPPFRPRHQETGWQLRRQMDQCTTDLADQIVTGSLPLWQPDPGSLWQRRGGRKLVREEPERSVHRKFQRQGESLGDFAAEEAVQRFAHAHRHLGWRSEIPQPEGFAMVAVDKLPVALEDFPDPLEIYQYQGRSCCLAFCFTTADNSYDTPAFEPDAEGTDAQSVAGLLRALHDLGLWSSLGCLHTSTLRLYHLFRDHQARPELLLTALFTSYQGYPGKLHLWNTRATDQSDWGWSGLRDLGDLEFYPCVVSYVEAADAQWTLPGYAQRASFVNALAQNVLAALLHYMRLHRATDPDYHYNNAAAVMRLGQFLETGCDILLEGLLDDGTRLRDLFPKDGQGHRDIYALWRHKAAEEMIYWTARQSPDADCFARHFARGGRPSTRLYPGHPLQDLRYEEHFSETAGDNLGACNRKFPLFYLVRGLYVLAAGVADRLASS